jgi:hypothetical protein
MDRDRRVSANRGCDSYVKAILRALRAPAQVEVEPAEPAVAEPAPPDELHLTSSHTDKLIAQLLKRAESKPADEAACALADAPADDSADDSEDDSREDGRSHNGVRRAGVPRRSWKVVEKLMWIDRVALEQPASTAAPACSQAELIRATLARAQIPFLTGHAGMVNGKARGGQQHEYMARRLRFWLGREQEYRALSAKQRRQKLCRIGRKFPVEHEAAEKQLDVEADKRADDGRFVGSRWLSLRMRQLVRQLSGDVDFHANKYWRQRFRIRYKYSLRRASNLKRHSIEERLPHILRWSQLLREMVSDEDNAISGQWDVCYGMFPLTHLWNFDQVPLALVLSMGLTTRKRGKKRVHLKTPGAEFAKRQATLQVLVRAKGKQGRMAIIFRGTGKRITADERLAYEGLPIDIYFQKKAWADSNFTLAWIEKTLMEAVKDTPGLHLAFCDNLRGQDVRERAGALGEAVKAAALKIRVRLWNLLAGATDEIQVVDAGIGAELKRRIAEIQDIWLDNPEHLEQWVGSTPLTASDRRILMATWASQAWQEFAAEANMLPYFERCGSAMGLAGAKDPQTGELLDSRIRLEGVSKELMETFREGLLLPPSPLPAKPLMEILMVCIHGNTVVV